MGGTRRKHCRGAGSTLVGEHETGWPDRFMGATRVKHSGKFHFGLEHGHSCPMPPGFDPPHPGGTKAWIGVGGILGNQILTWHWTGMSALRRSSAVWAGGGGWEWATVGAGSANPATRCSIAILPACGKAGRIRDCSRRNGKFGPFLHRCESSGRTTPAATGSDRCAAIAGWLHARYSLSSF